MPHAEHRCEGTPLSSPAPSGSGLMGTGAGEREEERVKKKTWMPIGWLSCVPVGWVLCAIVPVSIPIAIALASGKVVPLFNRMGIDSLCGWQLVAGGIAIILIVGHLLMVMFWRSLQEHKVEKSVSDHRLSSPDNDIVIGLRKFLSEKFGEDLRLETDYRFPNGFRGDVVAVRGRGRFPIMCFEVVSGSDASLFRLAVEQVRSVVKPFVNVTRCFVVQKMQDGTCRVFKVRGSGIGEPQLLGSFLSKPQEEQKLQRELLKEKDEIEDSVERKVAEVKKARLKYPILFLMFVVTPLIESVAILSHLKFVIPDAVGTLLVFWIGAFLGVFGVGLKGYEPKISDLMS